MRIYLLCALTATASLQSFSIPSRTDIVDAVKKHKLLSYSLAGTAVASAALAALCSTDYGAIRVGDEPYYWDWSNKDVTNIAFPKAFILGAGTSSYQVEGNCTNTDWNRWEEVVDENGNRMHVQDPCGLACNQWKLYKDDIKLMDAINLGIYRFSIAWDKVQPQQDQFDIEAINHYKDICRELQTYGIKAHIGFHHYTDPQWFADLGGFERQENCAYFAGYCAQVMQEFKNDGIEVELWSTFNSPSGYAFHKYHVGDFPPGIVNNKQLTLTVLKNMCEAHVQAYQACKTINPDAQIGILKNIMQLDPHRAWHPMDKFACAIGTAMTDTCIFNFFTTGRFVAKIPSESTPFMANVEHENQHAPRSLDFIGLNYYSHSVIKNMSRFCQPQELLTDNPNYTIYPEGLYRAITTITQKIVQPIEQQTDRHLPIFVTENGIACTNPQVRHLFFTRYMYALSQAIDDGHDVRGYIFWSLLDNYEWGSYDKKYGLVAVDFSSEELTRTVKQDAGTQYYLALMKQYKTV